MNNIVDMTPVINLLNERQQLIDNGPIDQVIEFAKSLQLNHPLAGKYAKSYIPSLKSRFEKEGIDYDTVIGS